MQRKTKVEPSRGKEAAEAGPGQAAAGPAGDDTGDTGTTGVKADRDTSGCGDSAGGGKPDESCPGTEELRGAAAGNGKRPGLSGPFRGLETGTAAGVAYQDFTDKLAKIDTRAVLKGAGWLFYTGIARLRRFPFKREHDARQPDKRLMDCFDVFGKGFDKTLPVPAGRDGQQKTDFQEALMSVGTAIKAAAQGGDVSLLIMPGEDLAPVAEKRRLWTSFEAWIITHPDSKVKRIIRYNADNYKEPGTVAWLRGRDDQIGDEPDFTTL